jgi:hypothetical protein
MNRAVKVAGRSLQRDPGTGCTRVDIAHDGPIIEHDVVKHRRAVFPNDHVADRRRHDIRGEGRVSGTAHDVDRRRGCRRCSWCRTRRGWCSGRAGAVAATAGYERQRADGRHDRTHTKLYSHDLYEPPLAIRKSCAGDSARRWPAREVLPIVLWWRETKISVYESSNYLRGA